MIEWLKQLTPEFYIIVGFLVLLIIFEIIHIVRLVFISRRLGEQDFEILEAIVKDETGEFIFDFTVSNKAFSTNYLNKIGFKNANIIQILAETNVTIAPRTKHVSTFPLKKIEALTIDQQTKYQKIRLYAENELGLRQESKGKIINKYLKRKFKANKKQAKKEAKAKRFETGNYNFGERVGLIFKLFFRPFYKLAQKMRLSTNRTLKESEIRRIQKAEHDKVETKLSETIAKTKEIQIKEESYQENKTRETKLELLKQEKVFELEALKQAKYEEAFEMKKAELMAIDPKQETEKYFEEHPIDYDYIESKIIHYLSDEEKTLLIDKAAEKIALRAEQAKAVELEKEAAVKQALEQAQEKERAEREAAEKAKAEKEAAEKAEAEKERAEIEAAEKAKAEKEAAEKAEAEKEAAEKAKAEKEAAEKAKAEKEAAEKAKAEKEAAEKAKAEKEAAAKAKAEKEAAEKAKAEKEAAAKAKAEKEKAKEEAEAKKVEEPKKEAKPKPKTPPKTEKKTESTEVKKPEK
ncbi:MAG: hypothetical protein GX149_00945 [Acholeplasmataceae bacterium]|jgi:hypothetical protein|nr:hypothetical protein [Acholeplasmataceae bacterium]